MSQQLSNGKRYKFADPDGGETSCTFDVIRVDEGCINANFILPEKKEADRDVWEEDEVDVVVCKVVQDNEELFTLIRVGGGEWHTTYWPYEIEIEEVQG